jgi:hypothetical protein
VQGAVELTIASAIEAMTIASTRGDRDRSDAGHSGEVCIAREALGAGSLTDQDRGSQRPAAGLGQQLRTMDSDQISQFALDRLGFTSEQPNPFGPFFGDAHPGGLRERPQAPVDLL